MMDKRLSSDKESDGSAANSRLARPASDADCSTVAPATDDELDSFKVSFCRKSSGSTPLASESTIIFDWDDTLLPTSFIEDALRICPRKCALPARRGLPRGSALQRDFPCYDAILKHGELVVEVLTKAKALGCDVAILTLAERPWVFESADLYLPGINLKGLLQDLQIPVIYALEHTGRGLGQADWAVSCKRNAMAEILSKPLLEGFHNVLSFGDSTTERDAVRALLCSAPKHLCKSVKLLSDPSLKQLSDELRLLAEHLSSFVFHNADLDIFVDTPADLPAAVRSFRRDLSHLK